MKAMLVVVFWLIIVSLWAVLLAIALGGPRDLPPMASINAPFERVDYSGLPVISHFVARDGTSLAYRAYTPTGSEAVGSVVLVHGSSGGSSNMHVLAKGFAAAGYAAYALDIRGHGESGIKGQIAYVGQLEDDLVDFTQAVPLAQPATLVGFSSGGGFVLRFAGSARQNIFSNYLLLSPFISQSAPNQRPEDNQWVSVGVPRLMAITLLDAIGVHTFNHLAVLQFARDPKAKGELTLQYSFSLAKNFRPKNDYETNIRAVEEPLRVVAGLADEIFATDKLPLLFEQAGKEVPVTLLSGVGHIPLTLDPTAVQAAISAVQSMNSPTHK